MERDSDNVTSHAAIDTFADRCARATCAAIARLEANARRHHHDFARKPKICVDVSSHSRKRKPIRRTKLMPRPKDCHEPLPS